MMDRPLKILILEDNPDDLALIEHRLEKSELKYEKEIAKDRSTFEQTLSSYAPDVVLADHTLPQYNSLQALALTKKSNPFIAFILVTGTVSEEFAVKIMKQGADDYILKNSLTRLPEAINNAYRKLKAQKERAEMENELFSFLHTVSHDLKGPLGSIATLSDMARNDTNEKKTREQFGLIQESSAQLQKLLESLTQCISVKQDKTRPVALRGEECIKDVKSRLTSLDAYQKV
jgi:DNA-binding NtrC family response regulator